MEELDILFDYLDKAYSQEQSRLKNLLPLNLIIFDLIWTIYLNGTIMISICSLGKISRAVRLAYRQYCEIQGFQVVFDLECHYIDDDGQNLGEVKKDFVIEYSQ